MQRVRRKTPSHIQLVVDLILCDRIARRWTENPIDWTVVITQLSKPLLGSFHRGISHRRTISGRGVIVRLNVSVVIVRIVVAGVIRQVIPREESGIQSAPEAVVKNKEPIVEEMRMPPVPVAVPPISVMPFSDVVRSSVQSPVYS